MTPRAEAAEPQGVGSLPENVVMSMTGNYLRISHGDLSRLLERPDELFASIYPDEESAEWLDRRLDVDKSWHLIHYLLNGEEWTGKPPFFYAVLGGQPLSDEDVGYGPARFLEPSEVRQVAAALEGVSPGKLIERWDVAATRRAKIYPQMWTKAPEDIEYLTSNYEALRQFFAVAAANSEAVIVWVS